MDAQTELAIFRAVSTETRAMNEQLSDLKMQVAKLTGDGTPELEGMVPEVCRLLGDHIAEQRETNRLTAEQMGTLRQEVAALKRGQHRIRKLILNGASWIVAEDGKWHRVLAIGFLLGSGVLRLSKMASKLDSVVRYLLRGRS